LLRDCLRTVKVVLDRNNGEGAVEDRDVGVRQNDSEVLDLRLLAVPGEGVRRLSNPPQIRSARRDDLQLRVGHGSEGRHGRENGEFGEHCIWCLMSLDADECVLTRRGGAQRQKE